MISHSQNCSAKRPIIPVMRLAASMAAVAIVWLVVLPRVAALSIVRAHIERNEAAGVDPAAKYYTELPAMPQILERVRRARAR
jgi:hypothetical protein